MASYFTFDCGGLMKYLVIVIILLVLFGINLVVKRYGKFRFLVPVCVMAVDLMAFIYGLCKESRLELLPYVLFMVMGIFLLFFNLSNKESGQN